MKASGVFILATTILAVFVLGGISPAAAQPENLVCIDDSTSTSCPESPPLFSGAVGDQITVAVNVQNAGAINGFDIVTFTDPAVLQPMSNDLTGYVFEGLTTLVLSNSVDPAGTSRVAAVIFGGLTTPPTEGRLFATTYDIVGPGEDILIGFEESVLTDPGVVSVTVQTAIFFGISDFSIAADRNIISLPRGSSATTTITLNSVGFTGTVALTAAVIPARRNGLTSELSMVAVSLVSGGSGISTLTITTGRSTLRGSYTVSVLGRAGELAHFVTIGLTVSR